MLRLYAERDVRTEREMLRYVRPPIVLVTLIMLGLGLLWLLNDIRYAFEIIVFMSLFYVLLGIPQAIWYYKKMLTFLVEWAFYDIAVYDFYFAQPFLDDRIRLGKKCIYGRSCCTIMRYTDITKIYQYVHKTNYIEDRRELRVVDGEGKVWKLCVLEHHRLFQRQKNELLDEELSEVINVMLRKNRWIHVGYK